MLKRRIVWISLAIVFGLAVVWFLTALRLSKNTVTEANCLLVKRGMTQAELEAIFGRPADISSPTQKWHCSQYGIFVSYDDDGRVLVAVHGWAYCSDPPWHKRLARQLGISRPF